MKKFYESPVVELTGFSAEDVITTSVVTIDEINTADGLTAEQITGFTDAVGYNYKNANVRVYEW